LAVCSVAPAQTKTKTVDNSDEAAPRFEIGGFGGVQYWSVNSGGKANGDSLKSGGMGGVRFTYDLAKHWGLEATYDIYAVNNLRLYTVQPYPVTTVNFGARNAGVQGGPVFYFMGRDHKFRIFLTIGPEYITYWVTQNAKGFAQSPAYAPYGVPYIGGKDGAAMFYGGGFKYNFSPHFGMRADLRGIFTKNPNFNIPSFATSPGGVFIPTKQTINGMQATLGVEYRFGAHPVVPPVTKTVLLENTTRDVSVRLVGDQADVCPGTVVKITLTSSVTKGAAYSWTVNGAAAPGGDTTFTFDTTGKSAGTYTIASTVRAEAETVTDDAFEDATHKGRRTVTTYTPGVGSTTINIREYRPPTGSVSASPATIPLGGTSLLTSNFSGQCGGVIKTPATCTAAEGSISGDTFNSNGVTFDPNNVAAQSKSVLITCTTTDEKGGSGSATTTVAVTKDANPQAARLPDIIFGSGSARVNNAGKRVLLEQLKAYLDRDPTGHVIFVGHFVDNEPKPRRGNTLDEQRALNAAAVISAGTGICLGFAPSQILVGWSGSNQNGVDFQPFYDAGTKERPGSVVKESDPNAKYRRVEVYFVPTGAKNPSTVPELKDAASLGVASLGCPK
jgi:hypothetical protein